MQTENPDDLTPKERDALKALQSNKMPDPKLEEKIVKSLHARSLLQKKTRFMPSFSLPRAAIAAVACFVMLTIGYFAGRTTDPQPQQSAKPLFALLIFNDNVIPTNEMALINEYGDWMQGIAGSGRLASGRKLHDHGRILRSQNGEITIADVSNEDRRARIGGYFLIEASNYEEAVSIASTCPHLKYDGTIEVRELHRL